MSTGFSAGPQALGYFYQARYALLLILEGREESEISIERFDDVTFENDGNATELLQLKHHTNRQASLTDSSSDLWKTIRVWSTLILDQVVKPHDTSFTIITTASAPEGSIAFSLRPESDRNIDFALEKLKEVAQQSENSRLKKSFDAFQNLTTLQQEALVNAIKVLDGSSHIVDTTALIKKKLEFSVRPEFRDSLYERLEGWWLDKVIKHLQNSSNTLLARFEVRDKIHEIAAQFRPESLPIDYFEAEPPNAPNADTDRRRFVAQLKDIAINNRRIEKAILDYYRAFEQRSRWAREDLLVGDEIEKYERKIIDEWDRYRLMLLDEFDQDSDESANQKFGRTLFNWMDQEADIRIRPQVTEDYVMRGSYHILADSNPPSIYWHPMFLDRLEQLLSGAVE